MNWKERKVSAVMLPYIKEVLRVEHVNFKVRPDGNGGFYVGTYLKNKEFTVIVEDALCKKQQDETDAKLPVYSKRTLFNREKLERLMKENQTRGYHILNCDVADYRSIRPCN